MTRRADSSFLAALAIAASLVACGKDSVAGGSSEHENVLTARILDEDGSAVAGARAWLRPAGSSLTDSVSSAWDVRSDARGILRFDSLPAGGFRIEVRGRDGAVLADGDGAGALELRLQPWALLQACDPAWALDTVRALGTRLRRHADAVGCVSWDSVAPGAYPLRGDRGVTRGARSTAGLEARSTLATRIEVPVWVPIVLDSPRVPDSLLALLRPFDDAMFALPHQVERGRGDRSTDIHWVRLPSLQAGTRLRFLPTSGASDSAGFGAAEGWTRVVHFSDADSIASLGPALGGVAGILGQGVALLDSAGSSLSFPSPPSDSGGLSFWIRIESAPAFGGTRILSAGGLWIVVDSSLRAVFPGGAGDSSTLVAKDRWTPDWHLVSVAWNPDSAFLWIDGSRRASGAMPASPGAWSDSVRFGGFRGALDELRIGKARLFDDARQTIQPVLQSRHARPWILRTF
jgi:hypothetical protein